jgi:hypothetical protein
MSKLSIFLTIYNKKLQKQKKKKQVRWLFSFNPIAVECLRSLKIEPCSTNEDGFCFSITINGVSGIVKEEAFVSGKPATASSLRSTFRFHTLGDMILHSHIIPSEHWAFVTKKEFVMLQEVLQLNDDQFDEFMDVFHDLTYEHRTFLTHFSNQEKQKASTRSFLTKGKEHTPSKK